MHKNGNQYLSIVILLLLFNSRTLLVAQSANTKDSLIELASKVISKIKLIDKGFNLKYQTTKHLPYEDDASRTTQVLFDIRDGILRRLIYNSYDETYKIVGKEAYYFDELGNLFCHINNITPTTAYDVYQNPYFTVYYKLNDSRNSVYKNSEAQYVLTQTKFILDYYLSNSINVKYFTFDISTNNFFILKTASNTQLRSLPQEKSKLIKNIVKGTRLCYIDKSSNLDTLNNKDAWAWYKVRTKDGLSGWIWGHPSIVKIDIMQ